MQVETKVPVELGEHKALGLDEAERARQIARASGLDSGDPEAKRLELEARVRQMQTRQAMVEADLARDAEAEVGEPDDPEDA